MEKITLTETKTGYIDQSGNFIYHSFDDKPSHVKEDIVCGKAQIVQISYFKDNQVHRDNNMPARIFYSSSEPNKIIEEQYRINSVYHRTDGPALKFIDYSDDSDDGYFVETYYLLGKSISKEKFETPGFVDSFILEHS